MYDCPNPLYLATLVSFIYLFCLLFFPPNQIKGSSGAADAALWLMGSLNTACTHKHMHGSHLSAPTQSSQHSQGGHKSIWSSVFINQRWEVECVNEWKEVLIVNMWGARRFAGEVTILFSLFTPTHPFISLFSIPSLFPPTSNSTPSPHCFPHYLLTPPLSLIHSTSWPFLVPPFHLSTSPSLHPGFYQAWTYFNFCLYLSTLLRIHHPSLDSFPRSFNPSHHPLSCRPPTKKPSIHFSIPQLPALRTTGTVNLVEPQEVGHKGTLKHVTLKWGPNLCRKIASWVRVHDHAHLSTHTDRFYMDVWGLNREL